MKYLITGGNGFIGHHISKELLGEGHEILSYDQNTSWVPMDKSLFIGYLQLRQNELPNIKRVLGSTNDRNKFRETVFDFKPDYVIHLAALPLADESNKYGNQSKTTIFDATETALDVIREYKQDKNPDFQKFLFASSSMVYGDFATYNGRSPIPARESDVLDPKKSMYASYKAMGELLVKAFGYAHQIPVTIIRPSAVYGPTDANRRVSEIFVNNALQGKPLTLNNEGKSRLDFTYVADTAHGIILATNNPEADGHIFNITAGHGRSLKELADIINENVKNPVELIIKKDTDTFRPERGTLDITKAKQLLGYEPQYNLERGIKEYIGYVRDAGVLPNIKN